MSNALAFSSQRRRLSMVAVGLVLGLYLVATPAMAVCEVPDPANTSTMPDFFAWTSVLSQKGTCARSSQPTVVHSDSFFQAIAGTGSLKFSWTQHPSGQAFAHASVLVDDLVISGPGGSVTMLIDWDWTGHSTTDGFADQFQIIFDIHGLGGISTFGDLHESQPTSGSLVAGIANVPTNTPLDAQFRVGA